MNSTMRFLRDDNGADLVEYALLVGIVALGAIVTLGGVKDSVVLMFQRITSAITAATPAAP